jgi:hypothetical protein
VPYPCEALSCWIITVLTFSWGTRKPINMSRWPWLGPQACVFVCQHKRDSPPGCHTPAEELPVFFKTSGDEIMMTGFTRNMQCCLKHKSCLHSSLYLAVVWVPGSCVKYSTLFNDECLPLLWCSLSWFLWGMLKHCPNTLWNLSVRLLPCYLLIQKTSFYK